MRDTVAQAEMATLDKPRTRWPGATSIPTVVFYVVSLALLSFHIYRTPIYAMDSLQYMGNALLMEDTNPVHIHQRVYSELRRSVPATIFEHLTGNEPGAPQDQNASRHERAVNPYRFAEFLPLFAIRPLYNQTLYFVSKMGVGLVRSGVLISVGSYFLIGLILFLWMRPYASPLVSVAVSLLTMASPPLTILGRETTSDALASLVALISLYVIFDKRQLTLGLVLLLVSIYFRTDFVVLAGPVILVCWLQRWVKFWQGAALSALAVASVLCINHFAGDYGIKMLYYRNFVGTPIAPGEMLVQFSQHDYLSAFRSGITELGESFFLPFLLIGAIGLRSKRILPLFALALGYIGLHFLILPHWEERWAAVFYLSMVVCAVSSQELETGRAMHVSAV
jgi:branched-subunit amino acid transport protein